MNYKLANFFEYFNRGAIDLTRSSINIEESGLRIIAATKLKAPTKLDFLLAYVTMTIPAAMLARVVRKITNRKGTPLEDYLMNYYFDMTVKLLRKD